MDESTAVFPFTRIVKQEKMKLALLLNAVDPSIGGALIRGNKGTAKSTAVRSMAQFLPTRSAVKGCVYHCDPRHPRRMCADCRARFEAGEELPVEQVPMRVIELPLNATEDRVAGTLDLEHVLETGKRKFEPGILASANGNILYVDEINLLDDHIIDLLLDSAAMGRNYVEREGISFSHPAAFILVGTMNPEEGDLRPQLLDRFGLSVMVENEEMLDQRVQVLKERLAFDADPEGYLESCRDELAELRAKVAAARELLPRIVVDDSILEMATRLSFNFKMEGHRCDLALIRSARANAALNGRTEITRDDMILVAPMVLTHRVKKHAFDQKELTEGEIRTCLLKM
ncbi:MAG: AAA family ATPase [archaeon]|nr:AAA family ATPase [archaeon]